jgi:ketosteroid isomerase-like protein
MSPRLAWILVASLALPAVSLAQAAAEEEVVKAIHARLEAVRRNDLAAWATLVADDMMAPVEGPTRSKQSWLAQHKSWPREVSYWYGPLQDVKVRVDGDTAIATYHSDQLTEIGGQSTSVHKWQIETHVRRNGRWLLLGVADGLIPPEPKTAKIEASILDAYVGRYEWAPTLVSKIERKGDRLLEHLGAGEPVEWRPETATTFYMPGAAAGGDTSRIIFAKDAGGRITHYIYRELGATDRIVKKIE